MKHFSLALMFTLIAFPVLACPPSAPLLDDVPEEKRVGDYVMDQKIANTARDKLLYRCYEEVDNPCLMQCEAQSLSQFRYRDGNVRYRYSPKERKQALKIVKTILAKWNAMPSKGDASIGITLKQ